MINSVEVDRNIVFNGEVFVNSHTTNNLIVTRPIATYDANNNVALGYNAMNEITTNTNCIAIGNGTLNTIDTVQNCIAIGKGSAQTVNTANVDVISIGPGAMTNATGLATSIVALGRDVCKNKTTDGNIDTTCIGTNIAATNTDALIANTFIGSNISGIIPRTVAIGSNLVSGVSTRDNSVLLGNDIFNNALFSDGGSSIAIGNGAAKEVQTSHDFTVLGKNASRGLVGSHELVTIGRDANLINTGFTNFENCVVGHYAHNLGTASGSNGLRTTSFGNYALQSHTTGSGATFYGHNAANTLTISSNSTGIGTNAGNGTTTPQHCTFIGYNCTNPSNLAGVTVIGADAVPEVATQSTIDLGGGKKWTFLTSVTTVGPAGTASAPPATPEAYLLCNIFGTARAIPLYKV